MNVEPTKLFETLKATVFKNATNEELLALVVVANEYGLSPFLKELYAFPSKGGGITPIVSVDGWNKMLIRQPDFDGIEFEFQDGENGDVLSCTATIYVKNRSHPVKITEYFGECQRNTDNWKNMPRRMLRNRTLCQASRIAFGFSGIKHEEEADSIEIEAMITSMPAEPLKKIAAAADPATPTKTPQAELEALVVTAGYTFNHLQRFGAESGNIEDAGSIASFAEVPSDVAKRLLKAKKESLIAGLEMAKAAS